MSQGCFYIMSSAEWTSLLFQGCCSLWLYFIRGQNFRERFDAAVTVQNDLAWPPKCSARRAGGLTTWEYDRLVLKVGNKKSLVKSSASTLVARILGFSFWYLSTQKDPAVVVSLSRVRQAICLAWRVQSFDTFWRFCRTKGCLMSHSWVHPGSSSSANGR